MAEPSFRTVDGTAVPAVTADEMRAVDRIAVDRFGLAVLQMMENAGRNLATHCRSLREDEPVVTLAGGGGNGGGGLACARHLTNRDVPVTVVLDREPSDLEGAAATQCRTLQAADVLVTMDRAPVDGAGLFIDALIGYGLSEAPRGRAATLIEHGETTSTPVISLDVPSGYDATTGEVPGVAIQPERTLTLALPKTGLIELPGDLYLADLGIPAAVYHRLDIPYANPFADEYWIELDS